MRSWLLVLCALLCSCDAVRPPELPPGAPYGVADHTVPVYDWTGSFECSAVVISAHTVLTAGHCVAMAHTVSNLGLRIVDVQFPLGPWADVATLETEDIIPVSPAQIGVARGQYLWVAGYGCDRPTHHRLEVRLLERAGATYVHGVICPGDSGSPVYSARGELVAIAVAYFTATDGDRGGVVEWLTP